MSGRSAVSLGERTPSTDGTGVGVDPQIRTWWDDEEKIISLPETETR
jgi:hypothetical protein